MKITPTAIPEVLIVEPKLFGDERGFFFESYSSEKFSEAVGRPVSFVQDNHSRSALGVLRGIHYKVVTPEGKLVRVVAGEVLDVAVDLRASSPSFGKWVSVRLSAENKRVLWIPEGFGHGFVVLSGSADFLYKTTTYYAPVNERSILWSDPELRIDWQLPAHLAAPTLSAKDQTAPLLKNAEVYK